MNTATLNVAVDKRRTERRPDVPLLLMLLLLVSAAGHQLVAQVTKTTTTSGNWSTMTWSPAGAPGPNDTVVIAHDVTANSTATIAKLIVNSGSTFSIGAVNFTVSGSTQISGTLTDYNLTGTNTFSGPVDVLNGGLLTTGSTSPMVFGNTLTIHPGASFLHTQNASINFGGNVINNGSFDKTGSGTTTLSNDVTLSGSSPFNFDGGSVTVSAGKVVTNTGTVNISVGLTGGTSASTWINASGSVLNILGNTAPMGTGSLDASAPGNTVHYGNATSNTVKAATYHTITFAGGTKTLQGGATTVKGPLTIPAGVLVELATSVFTAESTTTVQGTLNDNNSNGSNTFKGDFSITGTGVLSTTANSEYTFEGDVNNTSSAANSFNIARSSATSGILNFNKATTEISGTSPIFVNGTVKSKNVVVSNTSTVTFNAAYTSSGSLSVSGRKVQIGLATVTSSTGPACTIDGDLLVSAGDTLHIGNGALTVNGSTVVNGFLSDNGNNNGSNVFNGSFTINSGGKVEILTGISASGFVFNNTFTNGGTFYSTSLGGIITFAGDVNNTGSFSKVGTNGTTTFNSTVNFNTSTAITLNGPAVVNGSTRFMGNGNITFGANLTVSNGAFAAFEGTGTKTVTGNATYSGSGEIGSGTTVFYNGSVTIGADDTLRNHGTATVTGTLNGSAAAATWINEANSTLTYKGNSTPMSGGLLDASGLNNKVIYANVSGTQGVRSATYHHIEFATSGSTKSLPDITVNGNFVRGAGVSFTFSPSTTQKITFASNNDAIWNLGGVNQTYVHIVVDKAGSKLTLVPGAGSITTAASTLTVSTGIFDLGTTNTIFRVNNDLAGNGEINMASGVHNLFLNGVNNSIGNFVAHSSPSNTTVTYARTSDQTMFESPNYGNVVVEGGTKNITLGGPTTVNGNFTFNSNVRVHLGSNDLILSPATTLSTNAAFGSSRMFVTDGNGSLIKEGTSVSHFTTSMGNVYPVGNTGGLYTPVQLDALTATIVGKGFISVKAVPVRQPNVPYYNNALTKYWDINTSNLSVTSANLKFTYSPAEFVGNQLLYEARVWDGTTLSLPAGGGSAASNQFTVNPANRLVGQWTAIDPTIRTKLYTYQSGDWSNPDVWTTDPSGSTLITSVIPGPGDQVVILNGRTVTTVEPRTVGSLEIENGGTLDLGTTTGHSFGTVSGSGLLKISSGSFPSGNFAAFTAATGGTVEYYNLPNPTTLPAQGTYNHLVFSNSGATAFTAVTSATMVINGNLTLTRTGSGATNLRIGPAAYTITVNKNVHVGAGTTWGIDGSSTALAIVNIHGNLVNDGTIDFQNGAAYTETAGRARLVFLGATSNTTATFNAGSTADLFNVVMTKNDGYELFMSASPSATVNFNGSGYTIYPNLGTLRLGPNLNIARLVTNGSNYDMGAPGVLPVFWIDGAHVTYGGTGGAFVPYGTLKITAGSYTSTTGQSAIVVRESGMLQIDGGTVNIGIFRTSNTATTHRGSFVMNGGTLNVSGNASVEIGYYAVFSLPYPENVFKMTGGTINISRISSGGVSNHAGILINSSPQNYYVTGGTLNVASNAAQNFDITSTAPFYDVNISRNALGQGVVRLAPITWNSNNIAGQEITVPARPLVVLNNLNITSNSSPNFNANGYDVKVGKNFVIYPTATFAAAGSTVIFNGNTDQSFTVNGTISAPGIGNIKIEKPENSVVTQSGSVSTITIAGNLTVTSGTFNIADRVNVNGNIINDGIISGNGRIAINGSGAQTISGNGNGQFQNVLVSGTAGQPITITNDMKLNGELSFESNRLLNISNFKLILSDNAFISGYNASRYVATSGFQSDGGVAKKFSNTSPFTFPVGTLSNYTPATVQFSAAPATWGTLEIRPVNNRQLYVTDPDAFEYYWRVKQSGFSGVPAGSVNHTYNYGNLPDNTAYIPGYYNYQNIAFSTVNNVNMVDEATNNIYFNGVSYFDGDFTAGVPAAFGTVVPYYSRTNGNWNSPSTWSNTGHNGPASTTIPNANVPVFIGDGVTYLHTVTVTTNNTYSGSLIIDAGSVLDLGTTKGHNFGALPYSTAGGAGRIRISSASPVAEFPAGDFGLFFTLDGGITEYYSNAADFTIPTVTAAPTSAPIRTYKGLVLNPTNAKRIKFPDQDLEIFQNLTVTGGAGNVVELSDVASRKVTVRGDLNVNGGTLRFMNNSSQTLEVKGNVTVGTNGTVDADNTSNKIHSLIIEGNLVVNGVMDLDRASDVALTFAGNNNRDINGTAGGVLKLSKLYVDKGNSNSIILDLKMAGDVIAPGNDWLHLVNGTLRISKQTTLTLTNQPATNFLIPLTAGLILNHSNAVVYVGMAASNTSDLVLSGRLEILNGTMNIGDEANNNHNDLEYSPTDIPVLVIDGNGVLNVNGQIRRSVNVLLGSLNYYQKGNSVVLVRGKNPENAGTFNLNRAKFEVLNGGSVFSMEDNALLIIDRSGVASGLFGDCYLDPSVANITGGEIRFGTGNTPSSQNFRINSSAPFWNLSVDGTTTNKTVSLLNNPITITKNLKIEGSSIFNAGIYDVTIGGNLINNNPSTSKGVNAGGYRVANASHVTTMSGSAAQSIIGTGSNMTNFGTLKLENSNGFTLSNGNISVIGELHAISGNVNANTHNIAVDGDLLVNTTISNSGAGFFICGASNSQIQTLSGNGSAVFTNFRVNNPAGINVTTPLTINGVMNFNTGLFYINNHRLTLGADATVTGSLNTNSMIRLNGVTSDGGVRKIFGSDNFSGFTYPIGVTMKYTPAKIAVQGVSTPGSVTVKPVNTRHPATTDTDEKELSYYWNTTSNGLSGATLTHTYYYLQTDVKGNENNYRAGRYVNNLWTPQFGIPGAVNATANTITVSGLNLTGDFTAGDSTEFDQLLVFYSRNATSGGNWNDPNSWSTHTVDKHDGPAATQAPSFNSVVIAEGHTITVTGNNVNAPTTELKGTLELGNTSGHNFGTVSGAGTLRMTSNASNQFIFPGGNFTTFTNTDGGTVVYHSTTNAQLPTQATYNNIVFTGAGRKTLPNTDLLVNGEFKIQEGGVNNSGSRNINLRGNFTNNVGLNGFTANTGTVTLTGANQDISGATTFYKLNVNGAGNKNLLTSVEVTNQLSLNAGIVHTGLNQISIAANGSVSGGSAASFVSGTLRKYIAASTISKSFEIGNNGYYTPVNITFTGNTNSTGSIFASAQSGDHPNINTSNIDANKTVNRYWTLGNSGVTFNTYSATFNFAPANVDGGAVPANFRAGFYDGNNWASPTVGTRSATSLQVTGMTAFGDFQIGEEYLGGITWTGSANRDWNNPANWTPNIVPGQGDNITIANTTNKPTFLTGGNGFCRNIIFNSGASLTVPAGFTLTVAGDWTAEGALTVNGRGIVNFTSPIARHTGKTTFKGIVNVSSGANLITNNGIQINLETGALMHGIGTPGAGGTVTGNLKFHQTGRNGTSYNYWSSPITSAPVSVLNSNRFFYNPMLPSGPSEQQLLAGWVNATGTMTVGRGYIATNSFPTFSGQANNGSITYGPLQIGAHTRFNLVGNPYPGPISASAFLAANPHIAGGAIYLWDDDGSNGGDYSNDDYVVANAIGVTGPNNGTVFTGNIAAAQSFFVEAANTIMIQFNNSMRTAGEANFFGIDGIERMWLNVKTPDGKYNELLLAFKEDATMGVDNQYDARKYRGNHDLAFYSLIDQKEYAIQALPSLVSDMMVPLGLEAKVDGQQTISLKQIENIPATAQVILEDRKLGVFHNLSMTPEYTYSYNKASDVNRFRLHFKPAVKINTSTESCIPDDGSITLMNPSKSSWSYQVRNESGALVAEKQSFEGLNEINNLPSGLYSVTLQNSFGSVFQQVVQISGGTPLAASINASSKNVKASQEYVEFTANVIGTANDITWDFGDGAIMTGTLNPVHMYNQPGIYKVTFIASNANCMAVKTMEITVSDVSTGISRVDDKSAFSVYPNPATGTSVSMRLNLPKNETSLTLNVIDEAGRLVLTEVVPANGRILQKDLQIGNLANGIYQVLIQGEVFSTSTRITIAR